MYEKRWLIPSFLIILNTAFTKAMKIKVIFIMLTCYTIVWGQVIVKQDCLVSGLNKERSFYPIFHPDGKHLLITSSNYTGLDLYNIKTKTVEHITKDVGAGFKTEFSEDGSLIYFRQST